jgi:hypothetical protein
MNIYELKPVNGWASRGQSHYEFCYVVAESEELAAEAANNHFNPPAEEDNEYGAYWVDSNWPSDPANVTVELFGYALPFHSAGEMLKAQFFSWDM